MNHILLTDLLKEMHVDSVGTTFNKTLDNPMVPTKEDVLLMNDEREQKKKKLSALRLRQGESWVNYKAP
jgi:hypothetical protein